jgi:hypothetical protein
VFVFMLGGAAVQGGGTFENGSPLEVREIAPENGHFAKKVSLLKLDSLEFRQ